MSIDLFVYAESPDPLQRGALVQSLRSHGWETCFTAMRSFEFLPDGPIGEECISGAPTAALLQEAKELMRSEALEALDELFELEPLASCAVAFAHPLESAEVQALVALVPNKYKDRLSRLNSRYIIWTSMGRTPASVEFQTLVWEEIGLSVAGILLDPQTGGLLQVSSGRFEPIPTGEAGPDPLKEFFAQVEKNGFPLTRSRTGEKSVVVRRLSLAQLGRLLEVATSMLPDPMKPMLCSEIIREFRQWKGRSISPADASVLDLLRDRYAPCPNES